MYEGQKTPHIFLDAVREAASKGGKPAGLTAKRKIENGPESPRATVLCGGGEEKDLVQPSTYKNAQ